MKTLSGLAGIASAAIVVLLLFESLPALAAPVHHVPRHHIRRAHAAAQASKPAQAKSVQVWVNTNSGVYHYPGERWYGRTKEGRYMSEDAAKAEGDRPTRNGQ